MLTPEPSNGLNGFHEKLSRFATGRPLRTLDLFAGCGGMSLGFHTAGFEIIGAVEHDPKALLTHANNFFSGQDTETIERHAIPLDITQTSPLQYMQEILHADSPWNLVDVVIGGPPCQAFARIGRAKLREIMQHPQAHLKDERASLYIKFLEYVEFFRPLAVLIENVPDILNFSGKNVAEEIAATLEELGYRTSYSVLNSVFYGVPQFRSRFFLIAILDRLGIAPEFPPPTTYTQLPPGYRSELMVALKNINQNQPSSSIRPRYVTAPAPSDELPLAVTARQALGDLPILTFHLTRQPGFSIRKFDQHLPYRSDTPPEKYAQSMRTWPGFVAGEDIIDHVIRFLPRDYPIFRQMQPGDEYPDAYKIAQSICEKQIIELYEEAGEPLPPWSEPCKVIIKKNLPPYDPGKFPNKWWKLDPEKPVRTLTAHIGKDTYSHIHYDSAQARVISVREAARLQSFPDGFKFTGPMNAAYRQIGNAVPPLLARALAEQIKFLLTRAASPLSPDLTQGAVNHAG